MMRMILFQGKKKKENGNKEDVEALKCTGMDGCWEVRDYVVDGI
jgi:hypothetical protein